MQPSSVDCAFHEGRDHICIIVYVSPGPDATPGTKWGIRNLGLEETELKKKILCTFKFGTNWEVKIMADGDKTTGFNEKRWTGVCG